MSRALGLFRSWSRQSKTTASPPKERARGFRRLLVEGLEDRRLLAVIPPTPDGSPPLTTVYTQATPAAIPDGGSVTSTVVVAGANPVLFDLNLTTFITHTFSADLDITLTSPAGTTVTITTDNGEGNDNVFNGTVWDDDANPAGQVPYVTNNGLVTDHAYVNGVTASPLVPEEALAAFIGQDPNGVWTLTVSDDVLVDTGTLNSWSLEVSSLAAAPTIIPFSALNNTVTPIADVNTTTSTITVSGVAPYLYDVNLQTFISHTFAADLDITLTSPAGTTVTITTDNGAGNDNVFNGTLWNDSANPGGVAPYVTNDGVVTDTAYLNNIPVPTLTPEEALGAFIGEDPNGTWVLTISDDLLGDTGTLNAWRLDFLTVLGGADFGDAPASYGTLLPGGAQHVLSNGLFLGASVDAEANGQPSANAQGDDANGDDENGVSISSVLIPGASAVITVNASLAGRLDAWIDFNRNGVFDPAEKIANNLAVAAGANQIVVDVPANAVAGQSYARFRVSTVGGLGPTGLAADGEVEDYALTIFAPAPGTAAVVPDPQNPGQNVLLINGTNQTDAIIVQPVPGNSSQIQVFLTNHFEGPFAANSFNRIEIFANAGDDAVVVAPTITKPTTVHAGSGNDSVVTGAGDDTIYGEAGIDTLQGGAGHDVILGGADSDFLYGNAGNDILIGGPGTDWLYGLENDDLMIGGTTAFDGNLLALNTIRAQWSSPASFNARVAALTPTLTPATVFNDGAVDYALGGPGRDWMLDFTFSDLFLDFDPNPITGDRRN